MRQLPAPHAHIPNPAHLSRNTNSKHTASANTEHGTHYRHAHAESAERSCPTLASLGLAQVEGGAVLVQDETTPCLTVKRQRVHTSSKAGKRVPLRRPRSHMMVQASTTRAAPPHTPTFTARRLAGLSL